jgi:DNA repair protein RadC
VKKTKASWNHPGGKLIELGPATLTDEELLAILIGSGYRGSSAQEIAKELLYKYGSLSVIMGKKLYDIAQIEGLGDVKGVRIAAALEVVHRIAKALERE